MKKFLFVVAALFLGYTYLGNQHDATPKQVSGMAQSQDAYQADAAIAHAYEYKISNLQVSGQAVVVKLLPDDNDGSRHQRFIVILANGQTLLVAHNIDIAPSVNGLSEGDPIMFKGQYEWNAKGGVLHWTHHDPNGSHVAGWLQHNGQTYQ